MDSKHKHIFGSKKKLVFCIAGIIVIALIGVGWLASTVHRSPAAAPTSQDSKLRQIPLTSSKDTSYAMNVLVIKYFPLNASGKTIDKSVTGDVGGDYVAVRNHTIQVTNNLLQDIPRATTYLGYKNESAKSALTYNVVATKEYTTAVPIKPSHGIPTYPDYESIMLANDICSYVDTQGINEVWLWAYQGPNKADGYPSLAISESKMSSRFGDISNSYRYGDLPLCNHTYRVYTYNYGRGTAEAIHSWGHQLEAELRAVDPILFANFVGPEHPQTSKLTARCGSVHNPPNSRFDYDYNNTLPQPSTCLDWQADGSGSTAMISCQLWGCEEASDNDNPQLNWQIWLWQNLPGHNNTKTYQGAQLRNWWDVHGDFDGIMGNNKKLTLS